MNLPAVNAGSWINWSARGPRQDRHLLIDCRSLVAQSGGNPRRCRDPDRAFGDQPRVWSMANIMRAARNARQRRRIMALRHCAIWTTLPDRKVRLTRWHGGARAM